MRSVVRIGKSRHDFLSDRSHLLNVMRRRASANREAGDGGAGGFELGDLGDEAVPVGLDRHLERQRYREAGLPFGARLLQQLRQLLQLQAKRRPAVAELERTTQ